MTPKTNQRRLAICDDDPHMREALTALLDCHGFQVEDFDDGPSVLDALRHRDAAETPELLLLDYNMPEMNGVEVVKALERESIAVPAIMLTASKDRDVVVAALRGGCVDFIDKPIANADLLSRVERFFETIDAGDGNAERTQQLKADRKIGYYRLLKVLGEGERGTVFLCEHNQTLKRYAMKTLRVSLWDETAQDGGDDVRRFIKEGKAIAELDHPNIIKFVEFGYAGGGRVRAPYVVMEYFPSRTLRWHIERPRGLKIRDKARIVKSVADALSAVHERGIQHRDVKPENVLIDDDLKVKVGDFGICHLPLSSMTGDNLVGTPAYMAPEYLESGRSTDSQDIFALGVLAYELFTSVNPFGGGTIRQAIDNVKHRHPVEPRKIDPDVPVEIQRVLAKALRKNPARRYGAAAEMADDLRCFLSMDDTDRAARPGFIDKFNSEILHRDWR